MGDWDLYSLFLLGLLGTGHCLGMCGPLVLALPGRHKRVRSHLLYHAGRITTYTIVGAVLGALGAGLVALEAPTSGDPMGSVARLQVGLSIVSAALLGWFGLARLGVVREPGWMSVASPSFLPGLMRVQRGAAKGGGLSMFLLGLMLGLLPCGLSFAAFAAALPAGGALPGGAMVFCFGVGTLPGLLLLGTVASRFAQQHRRSFDILAGLLLIGMAASLGVDAASAVL